MKHLRFSELGNDGKEIRKVSITQEQADRFNKRSEETGLTYKLSDEKDSKAKFVKISGEDFEKNKVISAINSLEFENVKLNKNTGVEKTQLAFDGLALEQKELVISKLEEQ